MGTNNILESVKNTSSAPILVNGKNVRDITANLPVHVSSIIGALTKIEAGCLTATLPDGSSYRFKGHLEGPAADVTLHNWKLPRRALMSGSIGVAESYMDRDWDSSDVTAFLELFTLNYSLGDEVSTPNFVQAFLERFRHWMNTNTKRGSKKNISAHYDLGNEFYSLWLDKSMTYSSALYENGANSLESAQQEKYRNLIKQTGIGDGDRVLEIGCGWGGFAEYVAKHTDAHVTGLTISKEQLDFARKRIFDAGLNEKVDLKFQDYREEDGTYDKIASVEMFEAVGEKYWPTYFGKVRDCLKHGGRAGLQIITIQDRSFEKYRNTPDFIQKYVFPGGMLPSPTILTDLATNVGLREDDPKIFGHDYARTLAAWRVTFWEKWDQIKHMGFDDRFKRMWEFYMHYCEAGFQAGNIDVRQVFYQKVE